MSDAAPLIRVERLTIRRGLRQDPVVVDVSLSLDASEIAVLLGEESGGGDALLRAIAGASDPEEHTSGSISYRGQEQRERLRLAFLPSAYSSPLSTSRQIAPQLERIVARKFSIPRSAAREELRNALSKLSGAPAFASLLEYPDRVAPATLAWGLLAATIAQSPELVLADDPVRGLSPKDSHVLTAALLDQCGKLNAALLYNARALDAAIWASGRIIVIRHGAIVEEGPVERLTSERAHAYTRTLFRALPVVTVEPPPRRFARGEMLLRVHAVGFEGSKGRKGTDRFNLELKRGASLALIGEEGSGRRKLVRTILGIEPVRPGQVVIDSVDIGILSESMRARMRRRFALIAGSDDALDQRMSVRDTVDEPLRAHLKLPREAVAEHREIALKRVGLSPQLHRLKVESLSVFDKRRLQVARAIVTTPVLTIIDEPLRGLDAFAQTIIRDLLADFREQEGSAFLVITSDLSVAQALSEDALVFKQGRVMARGPLHELLRAPDENSLTSLAQASLPAPLIASNSAMEGTARGLADHGNVV